MERAEGVDHDGELVGGRPAHAALVCAGVRTVGDAERMVGNGARAHTAAAREISSKVEDELVAIDVRVRVGARDGVLAVVERTRDERPDTEPAAGERALHRGGRLTRAGLGMELL